MPASRAPTGLGPSGRRLWRQVALAHQLDVTQQVQLEEACRAKDRLDKLDLVLRGDVDTWTRLAVDAASDGQVLEVRITGVLAQANATANLLKQLIAALRLPDVEGGRRPQFRGPRGAQRPSTPAGALPGSSLERARAAASGR